MPNKNYLYQILLKSFHWCSTWSLDRRGYPIWRSTLRGNKVNIKEFPNSICG